MTLVTLGDTVETTCIPVTPLHDVKRIEGTFAALLEKGQTAPNEDYVEILLTDDEPVFRPADRLRPYYPNVLGVRSTWFLKQHAGTQAEADLHSRVAVVFNSLLLCDNTRTGFNNCYGHDSALFVEDLRHADLLADDCFLHFVSSFRLLVGSLRHDPPACRLSGYLPNGIRA